MKIKEKYTFPCGMKIYRHATWVFFIPDDWETLDACPLHGKECSRYAKKTTDGGN